MDIWLNLNKRPCWDSIRDQTHEPLDYAKYKTGIKDKMHHWRHA